MLACFKDAADAGVEESWIEKLSAKIAGLPPKDISYIYVLTTSGSTGSPKFVFGTEEGLLPRPCHHIAATTILRQGVDGIKSSSLSLQERALCFAVYGTQRL